MTIAVNDICAGARTLRVVDVARGTATAIIGGGIVGDASAAGWTAPLIAAGTGANIAHVATNGRSVVRTIGGRCTRLVALRIGSELLVASGTGTAVFGAVVANSALVAAITGPLVATGASAVWHKTGYCRCMVVAVKRGCTDSGALRVAVVAGSTAITCRAAVVHLARAGTVTIATVNSCRVAIAVDGVGALSGALGVVDVARCTRSAVVRRGVVGDASLAGSAAPLISAGASAAIYDVSTDCRCMVVAVGGDSACLIAVRVGAVLFVPRGACATVFCAVVSGRTLVALGPSDLVAGPLIPAGASATWYQARNTGGVIIAVKCRRADSWALRIAIVALCTLTAVC